MQGVIISKLILIIILMIHSNLSFAQDETDMMGVCPTVITTGNGNISLNFSKEGKLVAFYAPTVGSWNIIPYTTNTNPNEPRYGAAEHEGVYAGIEVDGQFKWLWQLPQPYIQYINTNNPTIQIRYKFPIGTNDSLSIIITALAGNPQTLPTTSLQSFQIINYSSNNRTIKFIYYGFVHPTKKNQQSTLWANRFLSLQGWDFNDPSATEAYRKSGRVIVRPIIGQGQYLCLGATLGSSTIVESFNKTKFAGFISPTTGVYNNNGVDWGSIFLNDSIAQGQTMNWAVRYDLSVINPGSFKTLNIFTSIGQSETDAVNYFSNAISMGAPAFRNSAETWWNNQAFIQKIENLIGLNQQEKNLLKRWTVTSRMLIDNQTGAIIASPNRQPKYYSVWVRDGIYQALLWETLDERNIVDKFIEFLISISETTIRNNLTLRYWRQCYSVLPDPNGNYYQGFPILINGINPLGSFGVVEEDQMGTFLWAIYTIAKHRMPQNPSLGRPSTISIEQIRQIGNTIVERITPVNDPEVPIGKIPGLLQPSFDWYEFPENTGILDIPAAFHDSSRAAISQSIYTNSAAASGLMSAYYFTHVSLFQQKASSITSTIESRFIRTTNTTDSTLRPPAYVSVGTFSLQTFTFGAAAYRQSTRLKNNIIAVAWPFNVFTWNRQFIINYGNYVDFALNTLKFDPVKKCFTPAFLMSSIFDLYKTNSNSVKIDELVNQLKFSQIGYVPENFYYQNNTFKSKGASPLGWSNAWGALALLAKAGRKLPLFDLINPQPSVQKVYASKDAYCEALNGSLNYNNQNLKVGVTSTPLNFYYAGLYFPMPNINPANLQQANLVLTKQSGAGTLGRIDAVRIICPWEETQLTGIFLNSCATTASIGSATNVSGDMTIDITSTVRSWLSNPSTNNGLLLIPQNSSSITTLTYFDREHGNENTKPGIIMNLNPTTNIDEIPSELPTAFHLSQNYPNPFNNSTTISFGIPNESHVNLTVYDILGRKIITLINVRKKQGMYDIYFDASSLSSGIYLYRLVTDNFTATRKCILMK